MAEPAEDLKQLVENFSQGNVDLIKFQKFCELGHGRRLLETLNIIK